MRRTSKVVRYSSQDGMAVLETKAYNDLQSITMVADGNILKASGGFLQSKLSTAMVPQSNLIHPS